MFVLAVGDIELRKMVLLLLVLLGIGVLITVRVIPSAGRLLAGYIRLKLLSVMCWERKAEASSSAVVIVVSDAISLGVGTL